MIKKTLMTLLASLVTLTIIVRVASRPQTRTSAISSMMSATKLPASHLRSLNPSALKGVKGKSKKEHLEIEHLIDNLTLVSEQGMGFDSMAQIIGFMPLDKGAFGGGVLGTTQPTVCPAMRELVTQGIKAMPELLRHLDDSRETKLKVGTGGFFTGKWFSDEYDSRYSDPKLQSHKVNTIKGLGRDVKQYTLRVGDLCYVAIGQIVNRNLNALRYQPSSCLVINSPVQTPELREAVKADWSKLTLAQHRQSLIRDVMDNSSEISISSLRASEAMKRLCFYYSHDNLFRARCLNKIKEIEFSDKQSEKSKQRSLKRLLKQFMQKSSN